MNRGARAQWGSRMAFILAAAGSAVGLGNIWKFPYIAGENGGGAFVLIYLACIAFVGVPIFIAELYIGQNAQKNTVEAFETLHKKGTIWRFPGWLGIASAFLIFSFYSVVGGWVMDFEFRSIMQEFSGKTDQEIQGMLGGLFGNPLRQTLWHLIFMATTVAIVLGGIKKGLERWNKILMPGLFILLILLLGYSVTLKGFFPALEFLFKPDASKLTANGILIAIGHSFFTLSLGMGAIITYGSYLSKEEAIVNTAFLVAILDTLVALAAGIVIFSVVFTFGMQPQEGPGLIFSTLPMLFSKMPGGSILSIFFFMLVTFAALTSAVSLLEVVITYWTESHNMDRKKSTIGTATIIWLLGLLTVFSTNIMSDFKIFGLTFFDLFDKLTANYFLPIGGLLISLYYGWVLGPKAVEKTIGKPGIFSIGLLWSTRVISPLCILLIIYNLVIGF